MRRVLTALALSAAALLGTAHAPAHAATMSTFSFTADFDQSLQSRTWSQSSGDTVIAANLTCSDRYVGYYVVRLYKDGFWSDSQVGSSIKYRCFQALQYNFKALSRGRYYFIISHGGFSPYSGGGSVRYPVP